MSPDLDPVASKSPEEQLLMPPESVVDECAPKEKTLSLMLRQMHRRRLRLGSIRGERRGSAGSEGGLPTQGSRGSSGRPQDRDRSRRLGHQAARGPTAAGLRRTQRKAALALVAHGVCGRPTAASDAAGDHRGYGGGQRRTVVIMVGSDEASPEGPRDPLFVNLQAAHHAIFQRRWNRPAHMPTHAHTPTRPRPRVTHT